ncbi:class I SAM-dependent methyltransferase [Kamptonema formosum]|uniref:class I SAM-dependent methyltransferase n=1 Tax=Kamptonema formosum TaxID=331992 RepID=UPI00034C5F4C|nr:methyltransferase domain-containing protein [Oscillatoria sp. PCC 10802]
MTEAATPPNAFREFEYCGWQQSADQYHASFGSLTSQTIKPLLDAVSAGTGTKLLDIATGPGYVSAEAFKRGCHPIGVDFSESMLAKAREIHPQVEFQQGDAESLPFEDAQFDAAVMNFGILHLSQPEKAISEAFRVIRSEAKFAFTIWEKPEHSIGLKIMIHAIETQGDAGVSLPEGPPFFKFSDPERCVEALRSAGFANPSVQKIPLTWELSSGDELFDAFYKGTARTGGLLRVQNSQSLENIRAAVNQAASSYMKNGRLVLPMAALVASAQK